MIFERKVNSTYYCEKCKKELETQDEHEECFYKNHPITIKYIFEAEEQNDTVSQFTHDLMNTEGGDK